MGGNLLAQRQLEAGRKHVRDLVPFIGGLIQESGWAVAELDAIAVGTGPGSYTGLRIGVMTARTLALATGARLLGISTFTLLANACQENLSGKLETVADAQQDKLYRQVFSWDNGWNSAGPMEVVSLGPWVESRDPQIPIAGPGVDKIPSPARLALKVTAAEIHLCVMARLALHKLFHSPPDDPMTLQPHYLRRSSAEELWDQREKKNLEITSRHNRGSQ